MITVIDEQIKVGAVFGGGKVQPKWFFWRGKKYTVQHVTHTWKDAEGRETRHHFAVTDGATLFEICYLERAMNWYLAAIQAE